MHKITKEKSYQKERKQKIRTTIEEIEIKKRIIKNNGAQSWFFERQTNPGDLDSIFKSRDITQPTKALMDVKVEP